MKKLLVLSATTALLFAACKKNDDNNTSKSAHLTSGKWFLKSTTSHQTAPTDTTVTEIITDPCELDSYIQFNANGTFTSDQGALKCDPSDPQSETGNWLLISNDSKLVSIQTDSSGTHSDTVNIARLDGSHFDLSTSYDFGPFGAGTVTAKFEH